MKQWISESVNCIRVSEWYSLSAQIKHWYPKEIANQNFQTSVTREIFSESFRYFFEIETFHKPVATAVVRICHSSGDTAVAILLISSPKSPEIINYYCKSLIPYHIDLRRHKIVQKCENKCEDIRASAIGVNHVTKYNAAHKTVEFFTTRSNFTF